MVSFDACSMNDGPGKGNIQLSQVEVVYLHGLGSGSSSPKGLLLQHELGALGAHVTCPDLNLPSFERLSPMAVIQHAVDLLSAPTLRRRFVVGSSFGGFVALHALARAHARGAPGLGGLILLAPAIDPWQEESNLISAPVEAVWERDGFFPLYLQEFQRVVPVHFAFLLELRALGKGTHTPKTSTLLIHGTRDEIVHYSQSERFTAEVPESRLVLMDDDHALLADPRGLVGHIATFLQANSCDLRQD